MRKNILVFWAVLVYCMPFVWSQTLPLDTIPFEIGADNRIYVTCFVNERSTPLRFLLDTGATDVVINSNSPRVDSLVVFSNQVENYSANSVEMLQVTDTTQTVRLGRSTVSHLMLVSIPYPPEAWDGVLGLSFFRSFIVRIDYGSRCIYLYHPEGYIPPVHAVRLPITYRLDVPTVPVEVNVNGTSYQVQLEVDTGSDRALDLNTPFVEQHHLRGKQKPFAISRITGTTDDNGVLENVFFDSVSLGCITLPRIPGALSTIKEGAQASTEMDGVMGNNLLQRFNQTYDFKNGYLYLEVNNRLYKPFYDFLVK